MTVEEMEDTLDKLGVEHVGSRGDEVQGFCPAHEERTGHKDRNPSWYINSDTGAHICFSCQYRGNIVSLVASIKNLDYEDAKMWINSDSDLMDAFKKATDKPKEVFEEIQYISEASLAAFVEPPEYALKSRGLSASSAKRYELLWDARKNNWIIPQRHLQTNELMGWQEKGYSTRFFKNYPTGIKKSLSLYGYAQYCGGDMIVVESPLDVVRLDSIGIFGGVAIYGSVVSDLQLKYIRMADRIVFAMDSDEAGRMSSSRLCELTRSLNFEAWFFDYSGTDMKDVGGMSKAEVMQGLESAKHSLPYATKL